MLFLMFISTNALSQSFIYGQITGIAYKVHTVVLWASGCGGNAFGNALVDTTTTDNAWFYFFQNMTENDIYTVKSVSDYYQFTPATAVPLGFRPIYR
jgi:hypothetical protein